MLKVVQLPSLLRLTASNVLKHNIYPVRLLRSPLPIPFASLSQAYARSFVLPGFPQTSSTNAIEKKSDMMIHQEVEKRTRFSNARTVEGCWREKSEEIMSNLTRHQPADAYTGRSVKVNRGKVSEAFRALDGILQRNKVRQSRLMERHEKKGIKRRRLSSEGWRRQFANEVRKKVQLVIKIRNRGA